MAGKTAVVVGAGPAGCLVSHCLASRGWKVEVFEKRPVVKPEDSKGPRGYPMALSPRSVQAIKSAGLDVSLISPTAVPLEAAIFNGVPMKLSHSGPTFQVDRQELGLEMYKAVASEQFKSGGSVTWHFEQTLDSIDFDTRTAVFSTPTKDNGMQATRTAAHYDLLVGADGYQSGVRAALEQAYPQEVKAEEIFKSSVTYKTFHNLPVEGLAPVIPELPKHKPRQYIYSYRPPGKPSITMWKASDNTMSGMFTSTPTWEEGQIRQIVRERFAGCSSEFEDGLVSQVKEGGGQRPSPFGKVVRVSQLHGPHCVLLGDAAHPVTSSMGQGCNLALETVRVFIDTLDKMGAEAAPAAFTRARLADAHAMQTMEFWSAMRFVVLANRAQQIHGQMRQATLLERLKVYLLMMWGPQLATKLPLLFRPYLNKLGSASVPYNEVLRHMQAQAGVVAALAVGVGAVAISLVGLAARAVLPA